MTRRQKTRDTKAAQVTTKKWPDVRLPAGYATIKPQNGEWAQAIIAVSERRSAHRPA